MECEHDYGQVPQPISTAGRGLEVGGGGGGMGLGFIVSVELEPELDLNSSHTHFLSSHVFCKEQHFSCMEKKNTIILLPAVFVQMFMA